MTDKEFEYQYALGTLSFDDLVYEAMTSTSKKVLTKLAFQESSWIRHWVAINPHSPLKVKVFLTEKDPWFVLCCCKILSKYQAENYNKEF